MEKEIKLKSLSTTEFKGKTILYALGENGNFYIGIYDPEKKEVKWNKENNPTKFIGQSL